MSPSEEQIKWLEHCHDTNKSMTFGDFLLGDNSKASGPYQIPSIPGPTWTDLNDIFYPTGGSMEDPGLPKTPSYSRADEIKFNDHKTHKLLSPGYIDPIGKIQMGHSKLFHSPPKIDGMTAIMDVLANNTAPTKEGHQTPLILKSKTKSKLIIINNK